MNNRIRLIAIAAAFVVGAATPTQAQNPATLLNVSYETSRANSTSRSTPPSSSPTRQRPAKT
jgi:hypothetical protein